MFRLVVLSLIFLPLYTLAQLPADWGAFTQRINAVPYQGKKFRLEAAVKVLTIDSTANGEIWVRVDRKNNQLGFFYNMMDKPIRDSSWKIYFISGKIDKDAAWFNFGGLYQRKGFFYFDSFRLMIENGKDEWEEIPLTNPGFEEDSTQNKGWGYLQKRNGMVSAITEKESFAGSHSFLIDASAFIVPKNFGNNDEKGNYADVNGIRMYYEIYGTGEPLLLLHGNSESIVSFSRQIPELSKYFQVIAVDSRGQGKSTEDGKKFTYELFAADTKALLDYLHLDSVNILGWSDGGNIGLIMSMQYPQKVRRLAIMGANLYNDNSSVKAWVNKTLKKQYAELKDSTANSIFRRRMIELLLYEPNINESELKKISCPVLVMAGSDDVIKEEHTKLIASHIAHSQLVIFDHGNHFEPTERPERFNKTVLHFFQAAF